MKLSGYMIRKVNFEKKKKTPLVETNCNKYAYLFIYYNLFVCKIVGVLDIIQINCVKC